ncbi:hypothetical protein [Streptomyces sp. NPDC050388]|uniref:hypothetical protein n=1 Tax=Streptomyces sp. NPDC050388 TaxID=3155781 RepID=UPI0034411742
MLLLGRHLPHEYIVAGLAADAVALEARKATQAETAPDTRVPGQLSATVTVTSLHQWKLSHLPPATRPLPSVAPYDQLLRRRRVSGSGH